MLNYYVIPPLQRNEAGTSRSVGFELEFSGLEVAETAEIIASLFNGKVEKISDFEQRVVCEGEAVFSVELDWQLGRKIAQSRKDLPDSIFHDDHRDTLLAWLQRIAGQVVPVEIVCPPLPLDGLAPLDTLVDRIRRAGAQGTTESLVYAFGVHINAEIPDAHVSTLVKYIQAFCLAQEWLFIVNEVDPVRRITPYINTYPSEYVQIALGYTPSTPLSQLIEDYLLYNNTRNRALDLLPLWCHLNPDFMEKYTGPDELTKPRPTFHYRLPNCEIEKNGWYLRKSWNIWCVVEELAANDALLKELGKLWSEYNDSFSPFNKREWHHILDKIYRDLS